MSASKQIIVRLNEKDLPVWVQQIGKVYRAHGVYLGRHFEGKGPNEIKAVADWRRKVVDADKQ